MITFADALSCLVKDLSVMIYHRNVPEKKYFTFFFSLDKHQLLIALLKSRLLISILLWENSVELEGVTDEGFEYYCCFKPLLNQSSVDRKVYSPCKGFDFMLPNTSLHSAFLLRNS